VRRVVAAALALVVFGACKVDVSVGVNARADGSGEVRVTAVLDEDAAKRVEAAGATLRTEDLEAAGWTVDEPETAKDGSVTHVVRHRFETTREAERILAQLGADNSDTGSEAPLRDFVVTQKRSFFRTETSFRGTVDLARGAEAFSDARLQETLDGQPLGVPVEQLERQLGASFDRIFGLQVAVRLPGDVESNAPTETDNGAVWAPKLGERVDLAADAARWNVRNIALLVVSVVAALALGAVLLVRRLSR
jgi:hypothetical protein